MNKQTLKFGLGLISLVLGSVISFPVKTIAGQAVIQGTTPDSSSTAGDSFAPSVEVTTEINVVAPSVSVAPGSSAENPNLQPTSEAQVSVNTAATNQIASETSNAATSNGAALFNPASPSYPQVAANLEQTLTNSGVSNEAAQELIDTLGSIATPEGANLPNNLLVAGVKATKNSDKISQAGTKKLVVDVNKLNRAINIYNKIVQEASPVNLQKLSQDQNFRGMGKILKELRAALG